MTAAERKWIEEVNELLARCPTKRFGFYTIGDPDVTIFDKRKEDTINSIMDRSNRDFGPVAHDVGAVLGHLKFPSGVYSTAG